MTQHLTEKSDVYSFGVVMMELVTGKLPIERGQNIVRRMRQILNKDDEETRGLYNLMDPLIRNTPHLIGFGIFVDLALRYVEETSEYRPNMCEIVREIELILQTNGSNQSSATSLVSDMGAHRAIPHPYNDSSSGTDYSSAGFQITYNVQPK
ncbi:Leucine-rich repeat protein kinase-like protein [Zostera marina]|uniref:non-specific serine/threonine protein kinase n=1 Tax=Zostera marina TaxID=29655 RepID=A0A0K9Q126_ZOSMR|nr:Leucine-rich repeat protein kinase-like protein [Zostera marina]